MSLPAGREVRALAFLFDRKHEKSLIDLFGPLLGLTTPSIDQVLAALQKLVEHSEGPLTHVAAEADAFDVAANLCLGRPQRSAPHYQLWVNNGEVRVMTPNTPVHWIEAKKVAERAARKKPVTIPVRVRDPDTDDVDIHELIEANGQRLWSVGAEWGVTVAYVVESKLVIDLVGEYTEVTPLEEPIDHIAQAQASFIKSSMGIAGAELDIESEVLPIEFIQEHFDPSTYEQIRLNGKLVGEMYHWLP